MMRALAMRLYHMGLDAHVVGDMCCPARRPRRLAGRQRGAGRVLDRQWPDRRGARGRGPHRLRHRPAGRRGAAGRATWSS